MQAPSAKLARERIDTHFDNNLDLSLGLCMMFQSAGQTMAVSCIFAYGTMRAEIDRWNMVDKECHHFLATARGFKLYQEYSLFYPFAVRTNDANSVIFGSVLHWEDPYIFSQKLAEYDRIEGYSEEREDTLYQRIVIDVEDKNGRTTKAYMYIQDQPIEYIEECFAFVNGDWLDRKAKEEFNAEKRRLEAQVAR